jgi:hypothetical protein
MSERCVKHGGLMPDYEVQQIDSTDAITGPGAPVYACHSCIRTLGLVPVSAGRRGVASIPSGRRA